MAPRRTIEKGLSMSTASPATTAPNASAAIRRAEKRDAGALAVFVNYAGEGLPMQLWRDMAERDADEDAAWAIGRARQEKKVETDQIYVVDEGDGAIAGLTGYPIGGEPEPITNDLPSIVRPLVELENQALETWYVNVLAADPVHRAKGWGTRLLAFAETLAAAEGLDALSIIVADNNTGARRLYERVGYRERARAAMIKDGWDGPGAEWILLVKPLT